MNTAQIEKNGKTRFGSHSTRLDSLKIASAPTQFVRKEMNDWDQLYAKRTHRMRRSAIRELLR